MQKVMCASVIVTAPDAPRPADQLLHGDEQQQQRQPGDDLRHDDRRGASCPASSVRPRKEPKRASAMPASVPRITAPVAEMSAMRIDSQAASEDLAVVDQRRRTT